MREVVMSTLRAAFDRAAAGFRVEPVGHNYTALESVMLAMRYATQLSDKMLAGVIDNHPPRGYLRALRMHQEIERRRSEKNC